MTRALAYFKSLWHDEQDPFAKFDAQVRQGFYFFVLIEHALREFDETTSD